MATKKTYREYRSYFVENFFTKISPLIRRVQKELMKAHRTDDFNGRFFPKDVSKEEDFILEIGQVIAEIDSIMDRLEMIEKLITSHSTYHEKRGFSRIQQHRRNLDWYFSEVYMLTERIKRLISLFTKESKSKKRKDSLRKLKKDFLSTMKNLTETRGQHVHRIAYTDKDLYFIEILEMSSKIENIIGSKKSSKILQPDIYLGLKSDRQKWKKRMQDNREKIEESIGYIYKYLNDKYFKDILRKAAKD